MFCPPKQNLTDSAAGGSQGADCSSCFWVEVFGSAALLSAKFPSSGIKGETVLF